MTRWLRIAGVLAIAPFAGCGSAVPVLPPGPPPASAQQSLVYAAVGASETVGVGGGQGLEPARTAWPEVFYNDALSPATTFYNFGVAGATAADALADQVPRAVAVAPDVVTVWLNVNDILHGVPVATYRAQLDAVVDRLRRGGTATVLVATVPVLDSLPAYAKCRDQSSAQSAACPLGNLHVPAPAQLDALVDGYNAAIAAVAAARGAVVVDLHAEGDVATHHPDWISGDGFHPSEAGYAVIGGLFVAAYRAHQALRETR